MAMMTAGKVLIELLRHEGVEYVFGIPGATEILFMDALEGTYDTLPTSRVFPRKSPSYVITTRYRDRPWRFTAGRTAMECCS